MNKSWDSFNSNKELQEWTEEWATEALRVIKPGGIMLCFAGSRTQHRIACGIEDAGWILKDIIMYVFGSGFPKSLNIGKSLNKLERKEWSKIIKALGNINKRSIMEVWESNSNNVKIVETLLSKNQIIAGQDMLSEDFVPVNVVENGNQEKSNLLVNFAGKNLNEVQATSETRITTVPGNVETEIKQSLKNVKSAGKKSDEQNHCLSTKELENLMSIFTVQENVKEWLKENTMDKLKVEEALKTLRGKKKYSNRGTTSVLCVALTEILKHTILNLSKTFQNLDTIQKMECVSATNVIITKSIMEPLITNMVNIAKQIAVDKKLGNEREEVWHDRYKDGKTRKDLGTEHMNCNALSPIKNGNITTKGNTKWEGYGSNLKPAYEPILLCMKPKDGTYAENVLEHNVGGLNIDGARIEHNEDLSVKRDGHKLDTNNQGWGFKAVSRDNKGRFPANLILEDCEEVEACFPDSKGSQGEKTNGTKKSIFGMKGQSNNLHREDQGSASRYFKRIKYCAKASKTERNRGLEDKSYSNDHPTIKPIELLEYLVELTKMPNEDQVYLDPFLGSGSTAIAVCNKNRNYIGIEKNEEYCRISRARIKESRRQLQLF